MALRPFVLLGVLPPLPSLILVSLGCAVSVVAAASDSMRVQEFIAPVLFAMIAFGAMILLFEPVSS